MMGLKRGHEEYPQALSEPAKAPNRGHLEVGGFQA